MPNIKKLKVITSTLSSNGGYILKLQSKDVLEMITPFGKKVQESQLTYYMKVQENQPVNKEAEMDISLFDVVNRPYEIPATPAVFEANPAQPDPTLPNHMLMKTPAQPAITIDLKWLQLKSA